MDNEKIKDLILEKENLPNYKILEGLAFLSEKHEKLKNTIINLSYELDNTELSYNKLLEEYKKRNKK
jgi:hypothetical protein